MERTIYLDWNASTACNPRVVEAMLPWLAEHPANPSSRSHRAGQAAATALDEARRRVAVTLAPATAGVVVFTSGATEANNLALRGTAAASDGRRRRLVTQSTEHASVLEPLQQLAAEGWEVVVVGVDADGVVRLDELRAAVDDTTAIVSVMAANNETGTLQPLADVARIAHDAGALLHCDAVQGYGKVPIDAGALELDLVAVSGHKVCGPKGIGALWMRRRRPPLRPRPMLLGGGQEGGLRSGTPNLPGAVGLATALELAVADLAQSTLRLAAQRDLLEEQIISRLEDVTRNGARLRRLPNTSNLSFAGIESSALLASLPDLALSTGSACTSTRPEPSRVLLAMGLPRNLAAASIRLAIGRTTSDAEIDEASRRIVAEVTRLRSLAWGDRR